MELVEVTTDSLEHEIAGLELHVGRVRARQMNVLAELDRRQIATADGCRSMTEWAASRLDIAPETASALMRTSRTINDIPAVAGALAGGEITFDRATELTRLAAAGVGDPIETGAWHDIAGLRREVSRTHRLSRNREHEAFADRYLAMQPNLDQTSWRLWGQLTGDGGRIVEKALLRRGDSFPPLPKGTRPTLGQRSADALVSIAQDSTTGSAGADATTPLVTVFVDATQAARTQWETGVTLDTGIRIGAETLEKLLCDGRIETITTTAGQPLAVGRTTRVISPALRRGILHRDGGACTADGCQSRYRLQPHHIVPFSRGGRTDPDNLTTLCWFHHHIVIHGMGFSIDAGTPPQRRRFLSPTGGDPPSTQPSAHG